MLSHGPCQPATNQCRDIPPNFQPHYQRNHHLYHVGLLQIDTFYLDTLSNISVNINGRHCMKHGNRQSTDVLQQLSPAASGPQPGPGQGEGNNFQGYCQQPLHSTHCTLLLAATHELCSFSIVSRWTIATSAL